MVPQARVRVLNNVPAPAASSSTSSPAYQDASSRRVRLGRAADTGRRSHLKALLLGLFFVAGLLINGDVHPLVRRGFFCTDSSIRYPFKPDTIGIKTLMFLALVLPGLVISFCDRKLRQSLTGRPAAASGLYDSARYKLARRRVSGPQGEVRVEEEELMTRVKRRNYTIHEGREAGLDCEDQLEPMNVGESSGELEVVEENERRVASDQDQEDDDDGDSSDAEVNLFSRIPLKEPEESRRRIKPAAAAKRVGALGSRPLGEFQLFFFGLCCTIFLTGLGKIAGGRLRPHFMARCRPNVDCALAENAHRYIEDFTCQSLGPREYPYITTSWPSGHASVIFYSMTYLVLYLNSALPLLQRLSAPRRLSWRLNPILVYSLYLLLVALAFWVAVTRVSDYHHHAIDVASGTLIGAAIAITLARLYSNLPYRHHQQQHLNPTSSYC